MRNLSPLALLLAAACAGEPSRGPLVVTPESGPTEDGARFPYLAAADNGEVVMSWYAAAGGDTLALRVARRGADGAWRDVQDVARRRDFWVNWADFPSVAASGNAMYVHYPQRNGPATYAYEVRVASSDGAGDWSDGVAPHRPGVEAEHGFVSLLPDRDGGVEVFFLDGGANLASGQAAGHDHGVPMSLSANRWSAEMGEATKSVLDSRICDCCQTSAAHTSQGVVLVYRDRTEDEIRDISIVRRVNGEWTTPAPVHADGWQINACPVNGPAVSASGDTVVVAWFTGARDTLKVQVAVSTDAGATFGAPVRVDEGEPAGRVDVEWLDGGAYVSWLERAGGDTAHVRLRRVERTGEAGAPITVGETKSNRTSGFPRMARASDGLLLAWTVPGTPNRVQMARVGHQQ